MHRILKSERSPDSLTEIRWIEAWLDADELHAVGIATGLLFDDKLAAELRGDIEPSVGKDDDTPFRQAGRRDLTRPGSRRKPRRASWRLWCELLGHSIVVGESVERQS